MNITLIKRICLVMDLLLKGCIFDDDLFGYRIGMAENYAVGFCFSTIDQKTKLVSEKITDNLPISFIVSKLAKMSDEEFLEKTIKYSMYALMEAE